MLRTRTAKADRPLTRQAARSQTVREDALPVERPEYPIAAGPAPSGVAAGASGTENLTFLTPIRLGRMVLQEVTGASDLREIQITDITHFGDKLMAGAAAPATIFAPGANLSPLFGHHCDNGTPFAVTYKNGHASGTAKLGIGFTAWRGPVDGAGVRGGRTLVVHGGPAPASLAGGASAVHAYSFAEEGRAARIVMEDVGPNNGLEWVTVTDAAWNGKKLFSGAELPATFFAQEVLNPFLAYGDDGQAGRPFGTKDSLTFTIKNNHASNAIELCSALICV